MTDEQRAPTKEEMQREIASIDRSIHELLFFGGGSKILINGDKVLRQKSRGKRLEIYQDLERDAHAAAVLDKRKSAVTSREWVVAPASEDVKDKEIAERFELALKATKFDRLCKDLLDATLKGYAVVEVMWQVNDGLIVPRLFLARDQDRFVFDIERRPRLLIPSDQLAGEELPDRKFIVHTWGGRDGSPYGLGLGHRIFWPVFFKRQNISFWLMFNEKYGSPTAKGTYPTGTNQTEQTNLLKTLSSISSNAGIIIPEGMVVELLEAARSGMDGYEKLCNYMDAEISKAVLGETLTTSVGSTGGNRALGDVHNEVRIEIAKDDADELSYTLNATLAQWFVDINYQGAKAPSVWRVFEEPEDLDKIAQRDEKLKGLGWQRTEDSFIATYGAGYERIAAQPIEFPSLPLPSPAAFSEPGIAAKIARAVSRVLSFRAADPIESKRARARDDQDTMADGSVQLAEQWEALVGPRVQQLQTLLDESGDLQLFRERLAELAEAPPSSEVVDSVARATFSSRLAGRTPRK